MIKFDLEVLSGSHAGRHIFKNSVITQASIPYVKGDLKTLGLELSKFSELSGRLEELLDVTLEVTKRTRVTTPTSTSIDAFESRAVSNGEVPAEVCRSDSSGSSSHGCGWDGISKCVGDSTIAPSQLFLFH